MSLDEDTWDTSLSVEEVAVALTAARVTRDVVCRALCRAVRTLAEEYGPSSDLLLCLDAVRDFMAGRVDMDYIRMIRREPCLDVPAGMFGLDAQVRRTVTVMLNTLAKTRMSYYPINSCFWLLCSVACEDGDVWLEWDLDEQDVRCYIMDSVRDVVPNPFLEVPRPLLPLTADIYGARNDLLAVAADLHRRLEQGGDVTAADFAVLADVAEDGLAGPEVVRHLRQGVCHGYGCWAVRLLAVGAGGERLD